MGPLTRGAQAKSQFLAIIIAEYQFARRFQMRGSPSLHALIWTSDCPIFLKLLVRTDEHTLQ